MKKMRSSILMLVALATFSFTNSFAQTEQQQRIKAAYMLTFGRDASAAEVTYWQGRGNLSIAQMIGFNQQYLKQDENTHRTTIDRAYQDALGRHAIESEITYWKNGTDTYATLMKNHISWLQGNPAEYEKVIKRSYQYVFNRQPSAGEVSYWKGRGIYSYVILVGLHQDYQRRNVAKESTGNQLTVSNSSALVSVSLSRAVGAEAFNAAGLVASGAGNLVASGAGNLVASGAGNLLSNNSGTLVASGAGNLVASGAGN